MEIGSSVASRLGLVTCKSCLNSQSVCPCQPAACPLLPKTFRSAGTSTERNVSAVSQRAGQTRRVASYSDCMHAAGREVLSERRAKLASAVRPDSGQNFEKQRSYDASCGFLQFCQKHIFANPTAISPVSGRSRKISQNPDTVLSSQGQCDSFSAHFNPCYSNSSPPDDDINLDTVSLCDSLCSNRSRKICALPALSEMSESCFEGLQSSTESKVIDLPRQFRPLSWAGPADDYFIRSGCSCFKPSAFSALKSETGCLPGSQLLNSVSHIASDELCMPLSDETPFYWELELPSTTTGTDLTSQTFPVPETCQKLASPLRMGTLTSDTGNVFETDNTHVAAKLLPNKPLCQNSGSSVDTVRAPKMGCLPARCFICRDCQRVCSPSGVNRHNRTVSGKTLLLHEVYSTQACKCMKQQRCPTPPRMLSPCVNDEDSVSVTVADI